ncbi:hypothetical protein ACLB90_10340 [Stenotrophomonas sp. LGBM10]|uniref:hypothetical protein n=1 Tax=Stenotrophomonas sp. LGBM10 TaxID=3390038 RepID=UPI00398B8069
MSRVATMMAMTLVTGAAMLSAGTAGAGVIGPSNMTASRYPEPRCQPPRRASGNSPSELSRYQSDVKEHFRCVEKYVEAAQNDIRRIQESMDEAVRGAKRY